MEHNGDVSSCDHYVEPDYRLGNIATTSFTELLAQPAQRAFGRAKRTSLPRQCQECPVRWVCNGGCPKDRFATSSDGEPGLNYLCAGYYNFFMHLWGSNRFSLPDDDGVAPRHEGVDRAGSRESARDATQEVCPELDPGAVRCLELQVGEAHATEVGSCRDRYGVRGEVVGEGQLDGDPVAIGRHHDM